MLSKAQAVGMQRSPACPGCQCDPSLSAKRTGTSQSRYQLCSWKEELSGTGSTASFSAVLAFLPPQSSMRITTHSIRKESTTQSSVDPQERAGLSSEVFPKISLEYTNQYFQLLWGVWCVALRTYEMLLTLLGQRKLCHFLPRSWTGDGSGGLARRRGSSGEAWRTVENSGERGMLCNSQEILPIPFAAKDTPGCQTDQEATTSTHP